MSEPETNSSIDPEPAVSRPSVSALALERYRAAEPAESTKPPRPAEYQPRRGHGFADPGLLVGRSARVWVYVVALLIAAAADVANFNQIIQFVVRDQQGLLWLSADTLLFVTVAGFTACVLFLAHISGVMIRDHRAAEQWVPPILPALCLLVWAALGVCGLYLRLTADTAPPTRAPVDIVGQPSAGPPAGAPASVPATANGGGDTEKYNQTGASMIFFGLYVGTGLVAIIGGYLTHNPAYAALRRARRQTDRAVGLTADSAHAVALARGEVELLDHQSQRATMITWADRVELRYQGEVLKMEARLRAAQHHQDPAFTDAWVPPPPNPTASPAHDPEEA